MPALGAILTAIITPFDADGRVDEDAFVAVQQHVCATGSDGVVVAGTTGEAPTLSDEEHLRIIELAVEHRPAGSTVIAGTGSNDTRHAVHLTERATALGIDGILSVTPYYNRPTPRGIKAHFAEVARATDRPDHPLQHPDADRDRHAQRAARRARAARRRQRRQAGQQRQPRAGRRPRAVRRQRRDRGPHARPRRRRRHLRRDAPARAALPRPRRRARRGAPRSRPSCPATCRR